MNYTVGNYKCKNYNFTGCQWTNDQSIYYDQRCHWFNDVLKSWMEAALRTVWPPLACAIGFICHPITFAVLLRPAFATTTFLYLRVIAAIEFIYTILVALWYYCKKSSHRDTNFCRVAVNVIDWGPLSAMKLFNTTLSVFLAYERLVAIVFPNLFPKISTRKFVLGACFCSFLIGALCLSQMGNDQYVWSIDKSTNMWRLDREDTWFFDQDIYKLYFSPLIMAILAIEAISMIGINLGSAIGLKRRQGRLATMVGQESAKKDLKQVKRLWQFQCIEAVIMFFDLLCQMAMNYYETDYVSTVNCDFTEQVYWMWRYEVNAWAGFFNNGAKYANHIAMFFLFIGFNKLFRTELTKGIGKIVKGVLKACGREEIAGITTVSTIPVGSVANGRSKISIATKSHQ